MSSRVEDELERLQESCSRSEANPLTGYLQVSPIYMTQGRGAVYHWAIFRFSRKPAHATTLINASGAKLTERWTV